MTRDMTGKQFARALTRHGMTMEGVMGYVNLGIPGQNVSVSIHNVAEIGPRGKIRINLRRALAYLLRKREEIEKQMEHDLKKIPAMSVLEGRE